MHLKLAMNYINNLPEHLQDKIISTSPHPITDIFKSQIKQIRSNYRIDYWQQVQTRKSLWQIIKDPQ